MSSPASTHPRTADVIVLGLGAMGSATADALARRGLAVVGLEAHGQGHALGSSHGPTRIIRRSIEEGPAYVPIVLDAFERWEQLHDESDHRIIELNGAIRIGPIGAAFHAAFRRSADAWQLPYETLDAAQIVERFPGFAVPEGFEALYEDQAGTLHAAAAVRALQERARRHGARLLFQQPVTAWTAGDAAVTVTTAAGAFHAAALVITAGAWTTRLLPALGLPLTPQRVVNVSFEPLERALYDLDHLPAFVIADGGSGTHPAMGAYGVPAVPGQGLKVGTGDGKPTDPDAVDRGVTDAEIATLRAIVDRFLPKASGPVTSVLTCLYTVTPDGDFVIDRHPEHANVVIASPCSGHGFKFASAIGPLLADLATEGSTPFAIEPFSIARFASTTAPAHRDVVAR
jgi:sarcosine oxidase